MIAVRNHEGLEKASVCTEGNDARRRMSHSRGDPLGVTPPSPRNAEERPSIRGFPMIFREP